VPGKDVVLRPASYELVPAVTAPPWPQQAARKSEAPAVAVARWARRNGHLTVPMAAPVVLWLSGLLLHHFRMAGYTAMAGAILAACVWFFAPHKWDRKAEQWYARLSASLAALWLWLAAWLGPLGTFIVAVTLASLLAAGTGTWGFLWWRHKRPRGQRKQARLVSQCDAWWQSHCWHWQLGGSVVIDAHLSGVTLRMRVRGLPGRHSLQHFMSALHLIESAAEGHADIGLVRIAKVPGKPSEVDIFFKQENPLREEVEYDLSIAPQSVHSPAAIGRAETGSWKMLPLRANCFIIGMTRSGKSNHLLVRLAQLSGCPDGRPIVIDLKGGRSARPVLKAACAEHVVTDIDEARMTLRMLIAEITARAMYAYDGNEQLAASPDIPSLHLMIDEVHGLTSVANGDAECAAKLALVASQGMGLEVYAEVYTQFGSLEESVRTDQTRGNLTIRVCYRVAEARHGAYVIPEYAKLDASRLEEKGTCYIKDGPEAFAEQVRAPHMPHALFSRIAAQNAALLGERPPLRLYCGAQVAYEAVAGRDGDGREIRRPVTWQEWWDTRWLRLHPAFRADSPQYQAAAADHPHAASQVIADAQRSAAPVPAHSPGAGDARSAAARIDGEDADLMALVPDDFRPDPSLVARLPSIIASQEELFADALQGATAASPATPRDLGRTSGRGRTWCHGQLASLLETGFVTQVSRGQYAPVPGASIRAGMQQIRDRSARLAGEARQKVNAA
jgi:hypothetical protein